VKKAEDIIGHFVKFFTLSSGTSHNDTEEAEIPNFVTGPLVKYSFTISVARRITEKLCFALDYLFKARGKIRAAEILAVNVWTCLTMLHELNNCVDFFRKSYVSSDEVAQIREFSIACTVFLRRHIDTRLMCINGSHRAYFEIAEYQKLANQLKAYEGFLCSLPKNSAGSPKMSKIETFQRFINCFCLRYLVAQDKTTVADSRTKPQDVRSQTWTLYGVHTRAILDIEEKSALVGQEGKVSDILAAFQWLEEIDERYSNKDLVDNLELNFINGVADSLDDIFALLDNVSMYAISSLQARLVKVCLEVGWKRISRSNALAINALKSQEEMRLDIEKEVDSMGQECFRLALRSRQPNIVIEKVLANCPLKNVYFPSNFGKFINGYSSAAVAAAANSSKNSPKGAAVGELNTNNDKIKDHLNQWVAVHGDDAQALMKLLRHKWVTDEFILEAFDRIGRRLHPGLKYRQRKVPGENGEEKEVPSFWSMSLRGGGSFQAISQSLELNHWTPFFQLLSTTRPELFHNPSTNQAFSELLLFFLRALQDGPHYKTSGNMLNLLIEFLSMIRGNSVLQKLPAEKLVPELFVVRFVRNSLI
jgi:hypothetical protein